jgi:4'-phosphopantetheinyl transferase
MKPHCLNEFCINQRTPKPGLIVWTAKIPDISLRIFSKGTYHNSGQMVNELFQKNDFLIPAFNEDEIKGINRFKALKKQVEWICGRVLVKLMVQHLFLNAFRLDQISLSYEEEGAPFVKGHPEIAISLSHSHEYTAAACLLHRGIVGIDIEKIAPRPDAYFMKTAFTENEISQMGDTALDVFKCWTIKEAYLKFIKKGFNESLHQVETIQGRIFHRKKPIDLYVDSRVLADGYVLSLVTDP